MQQLPPQPPPSREQMLRGAATLQRTARQRALMQRTGRKQALQLDVGQRLQHSLFVQSKTPFDQRYEIKNVLGQGAFGRVYLAIDRRNGTEVAVKEILNQTAPRQQLEVTLELFALIRATNGSPRCHPNVVCYYSHFLAYPTAQSKVPLRYIVIEYIKGKPLDKILTSPQPLNEKEATKILVDCLRGLQFLHAKNIAHRDIKPANIMLRIQSDREPQAVLVDLGLACFRGEIIQGKVECSGFAGTLNYIAPEIRQQRVQRNVYSWMKSDVYALGLVAKELFAKSSYQAHSETRVTAVVMEMLSQNPQERPSATEALQMLTGKK